jgi:cytochrome c553
MMPASSDTKSSKRPGQSGTPVMVRLQPEQLKKLDEWIARQPASLSRPEAVRTLLALSMGEMIK